MKTKLLVLIDFSPYTPTLLQFANAWSEKSGSEIVLIHQLFSPDSTSRYIEITQENIQAEKNKSLRKIRELTVRTINEKAVVTTEIITGDLIEYLKNMPDQNANHPILLGMKGNTTGDKPVMGKLTKALNENMNNLTVIAPVTLKVYLPGSLTVGLSYKYPVNKTAFNIFLAKATSFITHIRFVSVIASAKEYKKCHEYLLNLSREYSHFISSEYEIFQGISAFRNIKDYISQLPETMFVVQNGEYLFKDKLSNRFLINDLVYDTCIPLIIIPH